MPNNIIDLLTDDHVIIRASLVQLSHVTGNGRKSRRQLLEKVATKILLHTKIEEQIFYPAFKSATERSGRAQFFKAKEEHRVAEKLLLPELQNPDLTDEHFVARAHVLQELIERHMEEEEREMFPVARQLMDRKLLVELALEALDMKHQRQVA